MSSKLSALKFLSWLILVLGVLVMFFMMEVSLGWAKLDSEMEELYRKCFVPLCLVSVVHVAFFVLALKAWTARSFKYAHYAFYAAIVGSFIGQPCVVFWVALCVTWSAREQLKREERDNIAQKSATMAMNHAIGMKPTPR